MPDYPNPTGYTNTNPYQSHYEFCVGCAWRTEAGWCTGSSPLKNIGDISSCTGHTHTFEKPQPLDWPENA
jgi:hypothetical protein